jgi:hypothetical protein
LVIKAVRLVLCVTKQAKVTLPSSSAAATLIAMAVGRGIDK